LPTLPSQFTLQLPNSDFAVHGVIAEGSGSVLVIEYQLPACELQPVQFEAVGDNIAHSALPEDHVYIGTYFTISGGYLHVYGPRGKKQEDRRLM
jgi:hypothetical protein